MADKRRRRGLDFQKWIEKWFKEYFPDCMVHNQQMNHVPVGPGRWVCASNDILGCVDLIVIDPHAKPLFIQATLDGGIGRKLERIRAVQWPLEHCDVQVWVKRSPTRVSIKGLIKTGPDAPYELNNLGEIVRRKYVTL